LDSSQFLLNNFGMEDASVNTYNGKQGCDPRTAGGYFYGFGPISWEAVTAEQLSKILSRGWRR
jgi:hypothetical protein